MSLSWFVAACKTGEESTAERNLLNQEYEIFNPRMEVQTARGSRKFEQVFPGYIFIRFDPEFKSTSAVNNTFGIKKLIAFGGDPLPMADSLVDALRERLEKCQGNDVVTRPPLVLKQGDSVKMSIGGSDIDAIFVESVGAFRSLLLIEMLGSSRYINAQNDQIK